MAVVRNLQKMGASKAVILPKAWLEQLAIAGETQVELELEADRIVITRHRPTRKPAKKAI